MPTKDGDESSHKTTLEQLKRLPGYKEVDWSRTTLGEPTKWSPALQAVSALIEFFPHPTAIYWSDELSLLCNKTWFGLREGALRLGQSQTDKLTSAVAETLRAVMIKNEVKMLETGMLFDHSPLDLHILCSPIVDSQVDAVAGVLCQLLPYKNPDDAVNAIEAAISDPEAHGQTQASKDRIKSDKDIESQNDNISEEGSSMREEDVLSTLEKVPLDEHPFFRRFAALLPTGIAILNREAEAIFVNEHFYELTTLGDDDDTESKEDQSQDGDKKSSNEGGGKEKRNGVPDDRRKFDLWPKTIHEDHYDKVMNLYHEAFTSKKPLRTEFRSRGSGQTWRLLLLTPLGDDNLHHASLRKFGGFICAIVDITSNKLAEFREAAAAREAQERKEQQERFIDMISHEIRNPLSAVLHCAEDIEEFAKKQQEEVREELMEATDTIKLCVNHQKHIVDDILNFSKLDAAMLSLNPKDSQPNRQLGETLKMFQPEFKKQQIKFDFKLDYSYRDVKVGWVKADLVRISQILVNLITNSIKFTSKKQGKREISVALGACIERPTSYPPNVVFFDTENAAYRLDGTLSSEWGQGEALYVLCAVIDSGIGISEDGQKRLFERFRQATPKTEEIYGGSGLGLNIARKLCHLHGGEIGVKSVEGEGSTFGFFFKVRRTESPTDKSGDGVMQDDDMKDKLMSSSDQLQRHVKDADIPESLANPQFSKVKEANLDDNQDSEFDNTAEIAKKVDAEEDSYTTDSRSPRQVPKKPSKSRSVSRSTSGSRAHSGDRHRDDAGFKDPSKKRESKEERSSKSLDQATSKSKDAAASIPQARLDKPPAASNFAASDAGKTRVLLVEDNVINAKILRRKLEGRNFAVQVAVNGQEAVDAVQKAHPSADEDGKNPASNYDVILMDQEMPVKDGLTASREIRAWEKERRESNGNNNDDGDGSGSGNNFHIPILGVSANVRDEHRIRMEEAGIDDFLGKPYAIDDIVYKIGELVNGGNLAQEDKQSK